MLIPRIVVSGFSVGLMVLVTGGVLAQDYPNRPLRIVTTSAGSGVDVTARLIAQRLSASLGQQVIVDNRSGGVVPGDIVSKAPADGYTLLSTSSTLWIAQQFLLDKTPYDVGKDFAPVTLAASSPLLLVVDPSLPVKSVKELIALAQAKPGVLNYSRSGTGGSNHLAGELFKNMTGVNIAGIDYKGAAEALTDVMAGRVQVSFPTAGAAVPHIKSGKLRVLAVTSTEPSPLFPGLPTVAATVPGYEIETITAIFVPAKTPVKIINRLHQEIVRVLNTSDVRERLLNAGIISVASSPEQLAATVKSEIVRLGKLVKDAGIRAQ